MFHSSFRAQTGLAAVPQVEHEARVARGEPAELGRRHSGAAQELFDLPDQHHHFLKLRFDGLRFVAFKILLV
jgi:hypothetical protein